jgi:hypothetical protein
VNPNDAVADVVSRTERIYLCLSRSMVRNSIGAMAYLQAGAWCKGVVVLVGIVTHRWLLAVREGARMRLGETDSTRC